MTQLSNEQKNIASNINKPVVASQGAVVAHHRQPSTLSEDIQLGAVQLVQGTSHYLLKNKEAKQGDIYNTATRKVVGGLEKPPFEFVLLAAQSVWHWYFIDVPKKEFAGVEPRIAQENPEYYQKDFETTKEDKHGNTRVAKPLRGIDAIVLDANNLKAAPLRLRFSKTSYWNGGRSLSTFKALQEKFGDVVYSVTQNLSVAEQEGDGNTWMTLAVGEGRKLKPEELTIAKIWYDDFNSKPIAHNEDVEGE